MEEEKKNPKQGISDYILNGNDFNLKEKEQDIFYNKDIYEVKFSNDRIKVYTDKTFIPTKDVEEFIRRVEEIVKLNIPIKNKLRLIDKLSGGL